MEFNEKLVELRKNKGLTQEELASALYVSRTAVSKWESGRGVPNIESLKAISKYFSVSIDELLSSDELLNIADEDSKKRATHIRDLVFSLFDVSMILLLFFPLFGQKGEDVIREVSLLSLEVSWYIKTGYFLIIIAMAVFGVMTLALQNSDMDFMIKYKQKISVFLSVISVVVFILTQQPYAALYVFVFLAIKTFMLVKQR